MSPQDAERIVARTVYVMLACHVAYGETPEEAAAAKRMLDRLMANEPLTEVKLRFAGSQEVSHE